MGRQTSALQAGSAVDQLLPGVQVARSSFADVPLHIPLIRGERTLIIDAGFPITPASILLPAVQTIWGPRAGIDVVALTHGHHDHFGGSQALREANKGLQVAAHRADIAWVEDHDRYFSELFLRHRDAYEPDSETAAFVRDVVGEPVAVDRPLEPGDVLEVGPGLDLEVIAAPSHSPGSIAYYNRTNGFLITGDALQGYGTPLFNDHDAFPLYLDIHSYRNTIQRFIALDPGTVLDAHRGVLTGPQVQDLFEVCLDFTEVFSRQLVELVQEIRQPATLKSVAHLVQERLYPRADRGIQLYTTTATHLDELVRLGDLEPIMDGTVKMWAAS